VVVGRDIGTVVFPEAPLKFFLEASEEARAGRRSKQSGSWGRQQDAAAAGRDISRRDTIDTSRAASPLKPANDAIRIDTTELSEEEVLTRVIAEVRQWRG
jgi:cytidylate kinase